MNEPNHEYTNPKPNPYAVTLNETITMSGNAGMIDSNKAKKIGAKGPRSLNP